MSDRIRIAIALLPFQHPKVGEIGKKERAHMEAERISGRFGQPLTEDEAEASISNIDPECLPDVPYGRRTRE
jgi:hypothetical protein